MIKDIFAELKHNILRVYEQATPEEREQGLMWYQTAHDDAKAIALRHEVPVAVAIGVMAAISPALEWGLNVIQTDQFIGAFVNGQELPMVGAYGYRNMHKAEKILEGTWPLDVFPSKTSPKVRAFFECILDPQHSQSVCVDRHAKCLAMNIKRDRERKCTIVKLGEYSRLAQAYRELAHDLELMPHQLQAITWVVWKRMVKG